MILAEEMLSDRTVVVISLNYGEVTIKIIDHTGKHHHTYIPDRVFDEFTRMIQKANGQLA